jgi:multiple sugar transport system substrate-binding protein
MELPLALADSAMYVSLYDRLPEFGWDMGTSARVQTQLPSEELLPHLDRALRQETGPYAVVSTYSQYVPAQAPLLRPLDDLFDAADLADFDPAALERCRWEGRLYALPRAVETRLLFYRSDLFDERREQQWFHEASGGRDLRVPRAWDELAAVAQYFTRAGKMYGFLFPGRGPGLVATFAEITNTVGGTFFDEYGQPRFYSRAGEWALTLLRDLYGKWEAVPPETPQCGYEEVSEAFRMGRCALACDFPGTARLLCDPTFSAVSGWHSVDPYPTGPNGRRAVWTGCAAFAIPANCPGPEDALSLLRFLTSKESQIVEAKDGALPARLSAREQRREGLFAGTLAHRRFELAEDTARDAALWAPALPQWPAIEAALWPLLQQAIEGNLEPAEALQCGTEAVAAVLQEPSAHIDPA